jgi:hypothetical protein
VSAAVSVAREGRSSRRARALPGSPARRPTRPATPAAAGPRGRCPSTTTCASCRRGARGSGGRPSCRGARSTRRSPPAGIQTSCLPAVCTSRSSSSRTDRRRSVAPTVGPVPCARAALRSSRTKSRPSSHNHSSRWIQSSHPVVQLAVTSRPSRIAPTYLGCEAFKSEVGGTAEPLCGGCVGTAVTPLENAAAHIQQRGLRWWRPSCLARKRHRVHATRNKGFQSQGRRCICSAGRRSHRCTLTGPLDKAPLIDRRHTLRRRWPTQRSSPTINLDIFLPIGS